MKKLILSAMALGLIAVACWLLLSGPKSRQFPRTLALPDGTTLRVLAVTYGTNHTIGTRFGQFAADWPSPLHKFLASLLGQRAVPRQMLTTPAPELVVWVSRQTNSLFNPSTGIIYFRGLLGDGSNFISGQDQFMNPFMSAFGTETLQFDVFPRRDREIALNVFSFDAKGIAHPCGSLSFLNPVFRDYPEWQAEPMPATKRVGDLEVKLNALETGHGNNISFVVRNGASVVEYDTKRSDGQNSTLVDLALRPLENTNELWKVARVEVSDATGNSAHNMSMNSPGTGSSLLFSPSLWPGEKSWKLKLELKRYQGFKPEEIFTFHNVPLGELDRTNIIGWKTNVAGATVTLDSFCRRRPWTNDSWNSSQLSNVHFKISSLSDGTQLDLLRMVCDTGETNREASSASSAYERGYDFLKIPTAARTADFVLAIQQSRFVEFIAKPRLPKQAASSSANEKER